MPQTIETITVHLEEPPGGSFRDALAQRDIDIVAQVLNRLNQIRGLLFVMKTHEDIAPGLANALAGLETLVDDTAGLLTVMPTRGAA